MWETGEIVVWREIHNNRIWHAHTAIVVKDIHEELALVFLPGSEGMGPEDWVDGKKGGNRRWEFKNRAWKLKEYFWHSHFTLFLLEPQKYYVTNYSWSAESNQFLSYYVNFQLPFTRSHCGIDTLDLDLDLIINPDFTHEWKDVEEYQKAIENGVVFPEWTREIDRARKEILDKLEKRQYPYDGSWLNWMPDPAWSPPRLPKNWDKI